MECDQSVTLSHHMNGVQLIGTLVLHMNGVQPISDLVSLPDVDECADGSAVCGDNSYCSNKVDGYDCLCDFGYADDGFGTCVDVNECNGNNSCNAVLGMCINTEGAYS